MNTIFSRHAAILATLMLCAVACQNKQATQDTKTQEIKSSASRHFDTSINQRIWYYNGLYYLQTYILTDSGQVYPNSSDGNYSYSNYTKFAPYNTEINGSFKFIEAHKKIEYDKAHKVMYEIVDSLNYLRELPVK